jgi:metal-responsive CopG/Arc/MetJ family transcriptional regulator
MPQSRHTVSLAFRLRPKDHQQLIDRSHGNRSFLVKKWIRNYIADPAPLEPTDDNLKQTTISVEPELQAAVAKLSKERGVSIMTLVRQIVELNLQRNRADF